MLRIVGQTPDGRLAVAGVYSFFSTFGLPLDIIAIELAERGLTIAWDHFYDEAAQAGVGFRSIITRMGEVSREPDRIELLKHLWETIEI